MARADLLLDLVRAGARSDQALFKKALEALIVEERAKQHHILADRLAAHLQQNGSQTAGAASKYVVAFFLLNFFQFIYSFI